MSVSGSLVPSDNAGSTVRSVLSGVRDKVNSVDYRWFVVRTQARQEKKLRDLLLEHRACMSNILEFYCPLHTTIKMVRGHGEVDAPLFAGLVFVLATHRALADFLEKYYPEGTILYCSRGGEERRAQILTVPEAQMRFFMDFNENYADRTVILERPYSDYAFNPKTNEPNEVIKVLDGPFKGRIGYLTRFRKDRRLVFNMKSLDGRSDMAVAIPEIWNFHVVRLHHADGDRLSLATEKARAADLLLGILQGCGYGSRTLGLFRSIVEKLVARPSLVQLCHHLFRTEPELSRALARLTPAEAERIMYLVRYETDTPGYVAANWQQITLRPFLTPTSGIAPLAGKDYAVLNHPDFTEIVLPQTFAEQTYSSRNAAERTETVTYYAHVGLMPDGDGGCVLFANWDLFLEEYFYTGGNARKKLLHQEAAEADDRLLESFSRYAPSLYRVLTGLSEVSAEQGIRVGEDRLNVLAVHVRGIAFSPDDPLSGSPQLAAALATLVSVGIDICKEINSTTRLAVWRRYLRGVWLHE